MLKQGTWYLEGINRTPWSDGDRVWLAGVLTMPWTALSVIPYFPLGVKSELVAESTTQILGAGGETLQQAH
jgi:hypothetical protein